MIARETIGSIQKMFLLVNSKDYYSKVIDIQTIFTFMKVLLLVNQAVSYLNKEPEFPAF